MCLAGIVKYGVTCKRRDDGQKQLVDLNRDCWLHIRQFLKVGDILDPNCIERNMPNYLKTKTQEKTRAKAVLEQAVAVHLAFREMLHVKHIWNLDYRLPGQPDVSSDQLFFIDQFFITLVEFFIYFALESITATQRTLCATGG
ncbi:hypothetical protein HPB52_017152 [Rhipicephalus sanguineus]|uniref:Uncharacterized protein n=1 Tax=Rhipicephalus sanguineus TaxID=34632 RepID=A0A9D4SPY8_RHISA|nr:hypothetical protein HPB52_017152 [Rhipicephalus sanguineus]